MLKYTQSDQHLEKTLESIQKEIRLRKSLRARLLHGYGRGVPVADAGAAMAALRPERGLSLEALASADNLHEGQIERIEDGASLSISDMTAAMKAMGYDILIAADERPVGESAS